jgi:hypothetical protein
VSASVQEDFETRPQQIDNSNEENISLKPRLRFFHFWTAEGIFYQVFGARINA